MACYAKGHVEDAERNLLEGKLLCERVGIYSWVAIACLSLAEMHFMRNEYRESRERYDDASAVWKKTQLCPSVARFAQLGAASCGVMLGERDVNLESLRSVPERNRFRSLEGWTRRYLGEILLNLGGSHLPEAEQWMQRAIEADARNGMRFHLGLDHALYGEYFKRQGDRSSAQEQFGKAADILRECGADGWVEKYKKELAALQ